MEQLHILLAPNKKIRKVFLNVLVVGFRNGKSLKNYLLRATLQKLNERGRCEKGDSISTSMTFTTEACQENFKTQSGP